MTQVLICGHPWQLIQATQLVWRADPPETIPAIYRCPMCGRVKNEGEPEPRVIIGRFENDPA